MAICLFLLFTEARGFQTDVLSIYKTCRSRTGACLQSYGQLLNARMEMDIKKCAQNSQTQTPDPAFQQREDGESWDPLIFQTNQKATDTEGRQ